MKYPKIKISELKLGDCLLYEKTTGVGRTIQIITRSKFGHSSVTFIKNNEPWQYEANTPVFREVATKDNLNDCKTIIVQRPLFYIDEVSFIKDNESLLGKKYHYLSLVHQFCHQLWGGWKGNKDQNKPYCSKSTAWVYSRQTKGFEDWYKCSPDELFEDGIHFETYELIIE